MRLKQPQTELPPVAVLLRPVLETAQPQIEEMDRQIRQTATDSVTDSAIPALDAVSGIGPVTAAVVALCLKAKVFAHPEAFVAYIGLDWCIRDSGQKHGKRAVSKQSNVERFCVGAAMKCGRCIIRSSRLSLMRDWSDLAMPRG